MSEGEFGERYYREDFGRPYQQDDFWLAHAAGIADVIVSRIAPQLVRARRLGSCRDHRRLRAGPEVVLEADRRGELHRRLELFAN